MNSKTGCQNRTPLEEQPEPPETEVPTEVESWPKEDDFSDLDDSDLEEPEEEDDARWEVFLFDDEDEPLPDHGDFWLPD